MHAGVLEALQQLAVAPAEATGSGSGGEVASADVADCAQYLAARWVVGGLGNVPDWACRVN